MKTHSSTRTGLFLLTFVFLVSCTTSASQNLGDNLTPVTLQLKWFHQFQFAGYYAAIEQGYYREAGFDVTLVEGNPAETPQTVDEVVAGRADYGITNTDLLLERADGQPVVVLASIYQHSPAALAVREELNVTTPQQVQGLNMVLLESFRTAELQAMLLSEGVGMDGINISPTVNFPDYLYDENVDGFGVYMTNEPFLLEQSGQSFVYLDPKRYAFDFYGDLLYTTEDQIKENPEEVARFLDASLRGWEYAMAHQEEMVDLILTEYGSQKSRDHLLYEATVMDELILPDLVQIGHTNPGRWQHIADTYAQLGFLPEDFSLDGFIYEPPENMVANSLFTAVVILAGLAVIALAITSAISIFNRKLQNTVTAQIGQLQEQNEQLLQEVQIRTEAEQALKVSEGRFRAVWETAVDAMALSDANGMVIAANPAYLSLYQLTPEQVIDQKFSIIFPEEERENADAQYQAIFANAPDHSEPYETEVKLGDGQKAWVDSRIGFISENGQRIAMLSVVRNISQRRLAEKELLESQKMLADSEALAAIGSWKYDFETKKLTLSDELCHLFVVEKPGGSIPNDFYEIIADRITPADLIALHNSAQAAIGGELPQPVEFQIHLPNGQTRDVLSKFSLMENGHGLVGYVQDLTEQKQIQAKQESLTVQLRQAQKMESIGRLAGGVAHDFNNQLAVIQLYSDLILSQTDHPQKLRLRVERIHKATEHAANLTRQLLAYSRQQVLNPVSIDLNALISNLKEMLVRIIGEDIILNTMLDPSLQSILIDPVQIEQVVMNLVLNARDAMPHGGGLTIQTENYQVDAEEIALQLDVAQGSYVMLSITDTGEGMDVETQKKIFEPFFSTKEMGKGTGLGLATVHGIVKQSKGAILVQSEVGVGTTFQIFLQTSLQPAGDLGEAENNYDIPYGDETILLVEDEEFLRNMLHETLEEWGYLVFSAENGRHAQEVANRYPEKIDLLLTDVVMPHVGGQELAQSLAAKRPGLKVIYISGYLDSGYVKPVADVSGQEFLGKPFSLKKFALLLGKILDRGANNGR